MLTKAQQNQLNKAKRVVEGYYYFDDLSIQAHHAPDTKPTGYEISKKELNAWLRVCPKNDVRYYLNGAGVHNDTVFLTDGSRILKRPFESRYQVIIPREALVVAKGLATGNLYIDCGVAKTTIYAGGYIIEATNIDGRFPKTDMIYTSNVKGEDLDIVAPLRKLIKKAGAIKNAPMIDLYTENGSVHARIFNHVVGTIHDENLGAGASKQFKVRLNYKFLKHALMNEVKALNVSWRDEKSPTLNIYHGAETGRDATGMYVGDTFIMGCQLDK